MTNDIFFLFFFFFFLRFVSLLLTAHVEKLCVSRMWDFSSSIIDQVNIMLLINIYSLPSTLCYFPIVSNIWLLLFDWPFRLLPLACKCRILVLALLCRKLLRMNVCTGSKYSVRFTKLQNCEQNSKLSLSNVFLCSNVIIKKRFD